MSTECSTHMERIVPQYCHIQSKYWDKIIWWDKIVFPNISSEVLWGEILTELKVSKTDYKLHVSHWPTEKYTDNTFKHKYLVLHNSRLWRNSSEADTRLTVAQQYLVICTSYHIDSMTAGLLPGISPTPHPSPQCPCVCQWWSCCSVLLWLLF